MLIQNYPGIYGITINPINIFFENLRSKRCTHAYTSSMVWCFLRRALVFLCLSRSVESRGKYFFIMPFQSYLPSVAYSESRLRVASVAPPFFLKLNALCIMSFEIPLKNFFFSPGMRSELMNVFRSLVKLCTKLRHPILRLHLSSVS